MDITHNQSGMLEDDFDENAMFSQAAANSQPAPSVMAPAPQSGNPLAGYFRLPGLSVTLPTRGAFFPAGGIELDENGEVSVYPMKAADELMLSSPDALMNNSAIINLIASCVPQIKLPAMVSSPDLDVLLLAIRVASTGETMNSEFVCPKCSEHVVLQINIPDVLQHVGEVPLVNSVRLSNDLVVYVVPHTISVQSKILSEAFKQTRAAQALEAQGLNDEDRMAQASLIMKRMVEINQYGIEQSISKIVIPNAEVTDRNHIKEFMNNIESKKLKIIQKKVEELNNMGIDKTVHVECNHCSHEWDTELEFNPANFFEDRSSD